MQELDLVAPTNGQLLGKKGHVQNFRFVSHELRFFYIQTDKQKDGIG